MLDCPNEDVLDDIDDRGELAIVVIVDCGELDGPGDGILDDIADCKELLIDVTGGGILDDTDD